MSDQVSANRILRKQVLHASVIRACKRCGAPGYWHSTPGVNPGCYAPEKVTQLGADAVGSKCPNCGADREEKEDLGEIWSRIWRVSLWAALKGAVTDLFQTRRRQDGY